LRVMAQGVGVRYLVLHATGWKWQSQAWPKT
jgi:hypothetical protein